MDRCRSRALATASFMFFAALPIAALAEDGLTSKVIAPDVVIAGRTYGEWSAAWWQWALSIKASAHPLFDKGNCGTEQTGQVFFLGGKFCTTGDTTCNASVANRQCKVPRGKNLFFPIVNSVNSPPPPDTINNFRIGVQGVIDGATKLEVDLDGNSLKDLRAFRIQSSVFDFTLPNDNVLTASGQPVPAGTYFTAVDDGVYVMLQPLSPGSHLLHFTGSFPAFNFSLDITYHLKVSP
jgi:hypothetical protein